MFIIDFRVRQRYTCIIDVQHKKMQLLEIVVMVPFQINLAICEA